MMVDAHSVKLDEEALQDLQGQGQEGQLKGFYEFTSILYSITG